VIAAGLIDEASFCTCGGGVCRSWRRFKRPMACGPCGAAAGGVAAGVVGVAGVPVDGGGAFGIGAGAGTFGFGAGVGDPPPPTVDGDPAPLPTVIEPWHAAASNTTATPPNLATFMLDPPRPVP